MLKKSKISLFAPANCLRDSHSLSQFRKRPALSNSLFLPATHGVSSSSSELEQGKEELDRGSLERRGKREHAFLSLSLFRFRRALLLRLALSLSLLPIPNPLSLSARLPAPNASQKPALDLNNVKE